MRYAASITEMPALVSSTKGHSVQVKGAYQVHPRVWLNLGYAGGVEDFDNFSVDRIGDFRANTGSAGIRVDLPSLTSLVGTYEHQVRDAGVTLHRISVTFAQRF
jgi:hypothetical protein